MSDSTSGPLAENEDLVLVFMPPLATLLAHAEATKGTRLTEAEVLSLRDKAPCITMEPEDAAKLAESRGFHDVEPQNCWADWHRLCVEFTGNGYLPELILCVLGNSELKSQCAHILDAEGMEHEWREMEFNGSSCVISER